MEMPFDTLLLQVLIQRIGVVGPIPDQALRLFREEALLERFFDELRFLRRSTANSADETTSCESGCPGKAILEGRHLKPHDWRSLRLRLARLSHAFWPHGQIAAIHAEIGGCDE